MTSRADVYAALDSERDYQEMRVKRDQGAGFHSTEEFLLYMDYYLTETKKIATTTWGPEAKPAILEFIRKVTALGVACMEQHGAPQRKGFEREVRYPDLGSLLEATAEAQREPSRIVNDEEHRDLARRTGKVDRYAFTDDGFTGDKPSDT